MIAPFDNASAEKQSAAPCGDTGRAKGKRNSAFYRVVADQSEADLPALYLTRRFRLPMPVARLVASLALIGGRFA